MYVHHVLYMYVIRYAHSHLQETQRDSARLARTMSTLSLPPENACLFVCHTCNLYLYVCICM